MGRMLPCPIGAEQDNNRVYSFDTGVLNVLLSSTGVDADDVSGDADMIRAYDVSTSRFGRYGMNLSNGLVCETDHRRSAMLDYLFTRYLYFNLNTSILNMRSHCLH